MARRKFLCHNSPRDSLTFAQQHFGVRCSGTAYSTPQLLAPTARGRHLDAPPPLSRSSIPGSSPVRTIRTQEPGPTRGRRLRRSSARRIHVAIGPGVAPIRSSEQTILPQRRQGTFRDAQVKAASQQHRGALGKSASRSETSLAPKGRLNRVAMWRKPVEKQPRDSETVEHGPVWPCDFEYRTAPQSPLRLKPTATARPPLPASGTTGPA
jgi:hypothetical protein